MAGLPRKAYIISLNSQDVTVIFASGAYSHMIMSDMREQHFEDIFGITISPKTKQLEEQYEGEYVWDYREIDCITSADAEIRYNKIMERTIKED